MAKVLPASLNSAEVYHNSTVNNLTRLLELVDTVAKEIEEALHVSCRESARNGLFHGWTLIGHRYTSLANNPSSSHVYLALIDKLEATIRKCGMFPYIIDNVVVCSWDKRPFSYRSVCNAGGEVVRVEMYIL